jgi:hypothetical protein
MNKTEKPARDVTRGTGSVRFQNHHTAESNTQLDVGAGQASSTAGTLGKRQPRVCVIRDGREVYVRRDCLNAAELADVEKQGKSPLARRRFGVLLRCVRRAEDAPLKAALKTASDPKVSAEESVRILRAVLRRDEARIKPMEVRS